MAFGTPVNVATARGTGASVTCSAFTVPAGDLIIVANYLSNGNGTTPGDAAIASAPALTWTPIVSNQGNNPGSGKVAGTIQAWRAVSTGASMTVTVTKGSPSAAQQGFQVCSVSGTAAANFSNSGAATDIVSGSPVVTLASAPKPASLVLTFAGFSNNAGSAAPAGATEINAYLTTGTGRTLESACFQSSAPQTITYSTTADYGVAIAFEIASPSQAYAVAGAAGSLPLSALAAGLKTGRRMPAPVRALQINSAAAALQRGYRLPAARAAVAILGNGLRLGKAMRIACSAASSAIAGAAARLSRTTRVAAAVTNFVVGSGDGALLAALRPFGTGAASRERRLVVNAAMPRMLVLQPLRSRSAFAGGRTLVLPPAVARTIHA